MASPIGNIFNRSPWLVRVARNPQYSKQFSFSSKAKAEDYMATLLAQGLKARLEQLQTSFQLRMRRKGVKENTLTFDTEQEAVQALRRIEADLSVSIVQDYAVATRTTLRDLMTRYRDEICPSHKGGAIEVNRINRMLRVETFIDRKLAALSTEDLQDFITDRLKSVAPATVDRDLDILSQVLRYAADVWKIAAFASPFTGLRRPKYCNERDRRLTKSEEERLLAAARADVNPYLEPAIILALETAMRRGELLALTSADINFEQRYALVRDSKNGRSRKVPLTTRAMQVLSALVAENNGHLLNLTANALKIGFFRRVVPAAAIDDLHFHDLRHEATSRLAESGLFQLIELQAITGHRDMRMLQRYAHLISGKLAEKMDKATEEFSTEIYMHRGRRRKRGVVKAPILVSNQIVASCEKREGLGSNVIVFPGQMRFVGNR